MYEIDTLCKRYAVGSPTAYLGLDQHYSETVCVTLDLGIAQFGEWIDARKSETITTGGKKKTRKAKYKTLRGLLGIEQAERETPEAQRQTQRGDDLMALMIEARKRGEYIDPVAYLEQNAWQPLSDDEGSA